MITKLTTKELLHNKLENFRNEKVWIKVKRTWDKQTKRVGFLAGTITSNVNLEWYEKTLFSLAELKEEI